MLACIYNYKMLCGFTSAEAVVVGIHVPTTSICTLLSKFWQGSHFPLRESEHKGVYTMIIRTIKYYVYVQLQYQPKSNLHVTLRAWNTSGHSHGRGHVTQSCTIHIHVCGKRRVMHGLTRKHVKQHVVLLD